MAGEEGHLVGIDRDYDGPKVQIKELSLPKPPADMKASRDGRVPPTPDECGGFPAPPCGVGLEENRLNNHIREERRPPWSR